MMMAIATNIKGRYVFSNRLRKKASRAEPAVMPVAEKQKKCIKRMKRGLPSPSLISNIFHKNFMMYSI
jgi:hypothetical protein